MGLRVAELIELLKAQDQDLLVCYGRYSEQVLLEAEDIVTDEFCKPRPDGWIQNKRPDMPTQKYLVLPGN